MLHSRSALLVILLALIPGMVAPQSKTTASISDLAGKWTFSPKESSWDYGGKGTTWTITVAAERVVIQKHFTEKGWRDHELVLNSDRTGEENRVAIGATGQVFLVRSKTEWDKDKLVRRYMAPTEGPINLNIEVTETYKLSKDGTKLTCNIRQRTDLPGAGEPSVLVFKK